MSSGGFDLDGLAARVSGLDEAPVERHPDALEDVHRLLVSELDALSGAGSIGASSRHAAG